MIEKYVPTIHHTRKTIGEKSAVAFLIPMTISFTSVFDIYQTKTTHGKIALISTNTTDDETMKTLLENS